MDRPELMDKLLEDLKKINEFLQKTKEDFKMIHINWQVFDTRLKDFLKRTELGNGMLEFYIKKKIDEMKEKIDIVEESIEKLNCSIYQVITSIEIIDELRPKRIKREVNNE
jgi:hypothetical protein